MKRLLVFFLSVLCFSGSCLILSQAYAGSDELVKITFTEKDNIREIAKKFLKDPDLWPDILHANNLKLVHEIKPGMELNIPVAIILKVHNKLKELKQLIHKANSAGAKIFAKQDISKAILNQNMSLENRVKGKWDKAFNLAASGRDLAQRAYEKSLENRDVPAQAMVEDKKGKVQSRKTSDLYWKDAEIKTGLIEKEKVRTLSDSFAEILFKDQSRIRLNENAQIMIKQMRTDRLKKKEKSSVVLFGGDIYALLGGKQKKDDFDIAVTGVKTKIDSDSFWVEKQSRTTRFANYEGEIEVSSKGGKVVLKKNQGTLVKGNQKPALPKNLLPAPAPVFPENYTIVYKKGIELKWKHTKKAVSYWLEISKDESFNQIIFSKKDINKNAFFFPIEPEDGIYFWRLACFDSHGLPGPKSIARFFKILRDNEPPYAVIYSPDQNLVIQKSPISVSGKTEKNAKISSGNNQINLMEDGQFKFERDLKPGPNIIKIKIKDRAGNISTLEREVIYMPDKALTIKYDSSLKQVSNRHFITNTPVFDLIGSTSPEIKISIQSYLNESSTAEDEKNAEIINSTISDKQGRFQVSIPLSQDKQEFILFASLATGYSSKDRFIIEKDTEPPVIEITEIPTTYTRSEKLVIKGIIRNGDKLLSNKNNVPINPDNGFEHHVLLKPGKNIVTLEAYDIAGNIAAWEKEVVLDQEPPEFENVKFSKTYTSGNEDINIEIKAKDESGMKAGALFKVMAEDYEFRGYLRLCASRNCYKGKAVIPGNVKGRIKLTWLKLEDYLGNIKEYEF